MPDITLCKDDRCPFNRDCFRFTAHPDDLYQSYFTDSPLNVKKGKCDYFMARMFAQDADLPIENKAVEFADKLIELILQYEIGNATFEKAKVIIENKHVWAEVDKKKVKRMRVKGDKQASDATCNVRSSKKARPTVTLSLEDACTS